MDLPIANEQTNWNGCGDFRTFSEWLFRESNSFFYFKASTIVFVLFKSHGLAKCRKRIAAIDILAFVGRRLLYHFINFNYIIV